MGFIDTVDAAGGHLGRVQPDPGTEASRADARVAAQPPRDAGTVAALDARFGGLAQRAGRRPAAHRARRRRHAAHRCELAPRPRAAARQAQGRPDRRLLRGRLDHAALGHQRRAVRRTCSRTGTPTSRAGTPRTSAGARTRRSTCCGACRTASSTASTRRSSCSWRAPTTSAMRRRSATPRHAPPTSPAAWPPWCGKSASARPRRDAGVTGITPRNDNMAVMPIINAANRQIAALADGKSIRYININEQLALPEDQLRDGMAYDGLHLTPQAYQHLGRRPEAHPHRTPGTAGRASIARRRRPAIRARRDVSESVMDHAPKSGRPSPVIGAR